MASVSAADTWRETGARSDRSAGGPGERPARPMHGERPARPPLPPLPPLPSHGRAGGPSQRPPAAGRPAVPLRPAGQGRPVPPPAAHAQSSSGRATPGYPRSSASLAPDAGNRRGRPDLDAPGARPAEPRRPSPRRHAEPELPESGSRLRGSLAVLGVLVVTLAAGFVDTMGGSELGIITLVGLVGSTALATLLVRRRDLISMVVAPPLVYLLAVGVIEFFDRAAGQGVKQVVGTVATELALGQGFTVMAAATGTALVLALIRWAARR